MTIRRFIRFSIVSCCLLVITVPAISGLRGGQVRRPTGQRIAGSKRTTSTDSPGVTNAIKPSAAQQIAALLTEKYSRTPAEQKIDSRLLQAIRESRGQTMAPGVNLQRANVNADDNGMLAVDIYATINESLIQKIQQFGGSIKYTSFKYRAIRAQVSLSSVETIAGFPEIKFIKPAAKAKTNRASDSKQDLFDQRNAKINQALSSVLRAHSGVSPFQGSVDSEGDRTHRADDTRRTFGYSGAGVKIGVLSDSFNAFGEASQDIASGDLPGPGNPFGNVTPVTVVQEGFGEDEGRAMLQIIHDLAPRAQLFFATAILSEQSFADNIVTLRELYHCDIIIDDVGYFDEPVFQDGIVAQAVNKITSEGALYFSAAGNEGSVAKNTAGVWEGDFNDAGSNLTIPGFSDLGTVHNFGTEAAPVLGDPVTETGFACTLNWADPQGASSNDYDLFLMDSDLTFVKEASTNLQNGTQNPFEEIDNFSSPFGSPDRLVVFKAATAKPLAFSLNTLRGTLGIATSGQVFGHAAAADAFSVAATPAAKTFFSIGPYPDPFSASDKVEFFSSDGPRRLFFNADGSVITAGNLLFSTNGGLVRNKPDITAADGVTTSVYGFAPFFGTSAAAPHAGAIAALIKSAKPTLTNAEIRTILTDTALDIESPGYDNVSGFGILQTFQAMQAVSPAPRATLNVAATTVTEGSFSNGNGSVDPGEIGNLVIQLANPSSVPATKVVATISTDSPGVTIGSATSTFGVIGAETSSNNAAIPFVFGLSPSVPCGSTISFKLFVSFDGGDSPLFFPVSINVGTEAPVINSTLGQIPPSGALFTSTSGKQTGRLARTDVASTCENPKFQQSIMNDVALRQFDAYTFTNTKSVDQCVTVTLHSNGSPLFTAVYGSNGYNPTDPTLNYVADSGTSDPIQEFSFFAVAGQPFTIVVHEIIAGHGSGSQYSLEVGLRTCSVGPACTGLNIQNSSLANGVFGYPYSQKVSTTGGSGVYGFSFSGSLPNGLSTSGDTVSGIARQSGNFPITVNVVDAAQCPGTSKNLTLTIEPNTPTSVNVTAGNFQAALPGKNFTLPLQVIVTGSSNLPAVGALVGFNVISGGDASARFANNSSFAAVITDSNGIATAPALTANQFLGAYPVAASVSGINSPAIFVLTNSSFIYGDINGDGQITVQDAVMMANALAGNITLTPTQRASADVFDDHTGQITIQDLVTLANFIAGNIHALPVVSGPIVNPAGPIRAQAFELVLHRNDFELRSPAFRTAAF